MSLLKRIYRRLLKLRVCIWICKCISYSCFVLKQIAHGRFSELGYISFYADRLFCSKPILPSMVLRKIQGERALDDTDTLCIFCHFDPHSLIDDYVIYNLQKLKEELNATIVFVSNSEDLKDGEIDKIRHLCALILVRRNIGLDFAAWKQGIESAGSLDGYRRLLLTNDSIYGPIFPLEDLPELLPDDQAAILGLTGSRPGMLTEHLQSYFLMFNKPAFNGDWFRRFLQSIRCLRLYNSVVYWCEIGLSRRAAKAGVRLIPYTNNAQAVRIAIAEEKCPDYWQSPSMTVTNPTFTLWRQLMLHYQFPYVKSRVLKNNPASAPNIGTFFKTLEHVSEYPPELIVNHLQRVAPNAVVLDHSAAGKH
jgi:lipopolysaccharide biosynthesis protein